MADNIRDLISLDSIVYLDTLEIDDSLKKLVDIADNLGKLNNKEYFLQSLLDREDHACTGLGNGISLPHVKNDSVNDFFIMVGISKKGIDWNSEDMMPVTLVFLVGGPDDNLSKKQYLKIMAKLMLVVKNEKRRKHIIHSSTREEVLEIFKKF